MGQKVHQIFRRWSWLCNHRRWECGQCKRFAVTYGTSSSRYSKFDAYQSSMERVIWNYRFPQGLFHRAIGESGSVLAAWAFNRDPKEAEETCRKLAKLAGCPLEPYEDLIHCLRNIPARKIVKTFSEIQVFFNFLRGLFISLSNITNFMNLRGKTCIMVVPV